MELKSFKRKMTSQLPKHIIKMMMNQTKMIPNKMMILSWMMMRIKKTLKIKIKNQKGKTLATKPTLKTPTLVNLNYSYRDFHSILMKVV